MYLIRKKYYFSFLNKVNIIFNSFRVPSVFVTFSIAYHFLCTIAIRACIPYTGNCQPYISLSPVWSRLSFVPFSSWQTYQFDLG